MKSGGANINLSEINIKELIPYLLNLKALMGLALLGYALYASFTELPVKYNNWSAKSAENAKLTKSKNELSGEEIKLKTISKQLDKLSTKILVVKPGDSPELESIKVAQKVADLSEASQNLYMGLEPGSSVILNVSTNVSLPINVPGATGEAAVPPAQGLPGQGPATPAIASSGGPSAPGAAPAAPGSGAKTDSKTDLNAFQYTLTIRGSYVNLVKFINSLAKLPEFVAIDSIALKLVDKSEKDDGGSNIEMKLGFVVPWKN